MPAQDNIHAAVVAALQKDGWTITHDPLSIEFEGQYLFIDMGGERAVTADRGAERIAVEVKSFPSRSMVADLQQAVGQFVMYRSLLRRVKSDRKLYVAISRATYEKVFGTPFFESLRAEVAMPLVVVTVASEEVASWIE